MPLPIPDADLRLWRSMGCDDNAGVLAALISDIRWRQEQVTLWGRTYPQPRLVAFYGDGGCSYRYSGVTLTALPWSHDLRLLKDKVESLCDASFNSVLLNYYRDQRDSMGLHADDEPELGSNPVIASVSFGEARRFVLKHRYRDDIDRIRLELPSGSVLLMQGETQVNWKHGVPKQSKSCGPRVNLTFRTIL